MVGWLVLVQVAGAWETDPLTRRDEPLADAAPWADAWTSEMLDEAIARTNARVGCGAPDDVTRDALARAIYDLTSRRQRVPGHGPFRGMGHGEFSAWLEGSPDLERRSFDDRSDLFGAIHFVQAPILASAGTCSLVNLDGVLVGTDKPDHFWYGGYAYYVVARRRGEAAAVAYGTRTELSYYGLMTSSTFSFADLHANWQGYRFFEGLLRPGSVVGRDADGCAAREAPFAWADWVDWRWDEAFEPNVYTRKVDAYVDRTLDARRDQVCGEVSGILAEVEERVSQAIREPAPWASAKAPERVDPFRLVERCGAEVASPDAGRRDGEAAAR